VTEAELELLFKTADALEELVAASVGGREQSVDVTPLLEALDGAAAQGRPGEPARGRRRISFVAAPAGAGKKVDVILSPDSPLKARACWSCSGWRPWAVGA
jgi:hypothetical protein